jgi:aminobenzoyl-glutamate utilization protein B
MKKLLFCVGVLFFAPLGAVAQNNDQDNDQELTPDQAFIIEQIEAGKAHANAVALEIGGLAEIGYREVLSSGILQDYLSQNGFEIEMGVGGMPTAFVATYGSGGPVIGFTAEFDALPGFSQGAIPHRSAVDGMDAGHACGHHLLGTGAASAAIAVKEWLEAGGVEATLKVFGSPAEEGGGGKVYLTRAGLFDDVDVMINWHPSSKNAASPRRTLANYSGKFRFYGQSAHAAGAPERGRSALDAVEAMDFMVNAMREHVPQETRIHYIITNGGRAPNVVPDFAEVYYYSRHPDAEVAREIWGRIEKAAEGAAMGTETRVESEITNAVFSLLPNMAFSEVTDKNLRLVGGVHYDDAERAFAEELQQFLPAPDDGLAAAGRVEDFNNEEPGLSYGSTDVGDVSWNVPTNVLSTATWVPGTSAHSWQAVAAGNMTIGLKGMSVAAKTMALTTIEIIQDPELLARIKAEFEERRGADFSYQPMVGDREPPLDYRGIQ